MIIPKPQNNRFIDIETFKLLADAVSYYEVNNISDLKNNILYLLKNPDKVKDFKNKLSSIKLKFIRTWDERIYEEENILKDIVRNS